MGMQKRRAEKRRVEDRTHVLNPPVERVRVPSQKKYSVFVISPPHVVHHSFLSLQLLQIACSFSEYTVPILSVRETALWFLKPPFPRLQSKRVAPTSHHAHRRAKVSPMVPPSTSHLSPILLRYTPTSPHRLSARQPTRVKPAPDILTRAQRAHWRLSWEQRLAHNARPSDAPR